VVHGVRERAVVVASTSTTRECGFNPEWKLGVRSPAHRDAGRQMEVVPLFPFIYPVRARWPYRACTGGPWGWRRATILLEGGGSGLFVGRAAGHVSVGATLAPSKSGLFSAQSYGGADRVLHGSFWRIVGAACRV
jgi:hypothetical protein